jgi:hypothetical protein
MRIGLIQTAGVADIIIALPIAQYFVNHGHEVVWPIDARLLSSFQSAAPEPLFRAVAPAAPTSGRRGLERYYLGEPMEMLQQERCESIHVLYSDYGSLALPITNPGLARYLKCDEYKYAICGVPFAQKWRLSIKRNYTRERALFDRLAPRGPYVAMHTENLQVWVPVADEASHLPTVRLASVSDSLFDWLLVIERASRLALIDGCFANLVEQLGIGVAKQLHLVNGLLGTPVYRGDWSFSAAGEIAQPPKQQPIEINYSLTSPVFG